MGPWRIRIWNPLEQLHVELHPAPRVASTCEPPQGRKAARISGLWRVHEGSLVFLVADDDHVDEDGQPQTPPSSGTATTL